MSFLIFLAQEKYIWYNKNNIKKLASNTSEFEIYYTKLKVFLNIALQYKFLVIFKYEKNFLKLYCGFIMRALKLTIAVKLEW